MKAIGYAVITTDREKLCHTDETITGGIVFMVYRKRSDAEQFLDPVWGTSYRIAKVKIEEVPE